MATLVVKRNENEDEILNYRIGDVFYFVVGWKCDPLVVQDKTYNYAGLEFQKVIFETALPENSLTHNNRYLISRVRRKQILITAE